MPRYVKPNFLQSKLRELLGEEFRNQPPELQEWAQGPLKNYFARRFLTPNDELYMLAQQGHAVVPNARPFIYGARYSGMPEEMRPVTPSAQHYLDEAVYRLRGYKNPAGLIAAELPYGGVGRNPAHWLVGLPGDEARLGGIGTAWVHKLASESADPRYSDVTKRLLPEGQAKLWPELVDPLRGLGPARNISGNEALEAAKILRKYQAAGGVGELRGALGTLRDELRGRLAQAREKHGYERSGWGPRFDSVKDVQNPSERVFKIWTSPLVQMMEHVPASGQYKGAKIHAGMSASPQLQPFIDQWVGPLQQALLANEPWLANWKPGGPRLDTLWRLPDQHRHVGDALSGLLGEGAIRGAVLPRMSVAEAARHTLDWNRNLEQNKAKKAAREAAELLTSPKGIVTHQEWPTGWRVDEVTDPARLTKESCAAGATWCTRSNTVAENYLREGPFYLLRDPTGKARVAFQTTRDGQVKQVRNRKQSGNMSADTMPYVQEFLTDPRFTHVDPYELSSTGMTQQEWAARRRARLPAPPKDRGYRKGGSVLARLAA